MQQRRLRLGDILDDYCPRERRITNHVVVAMVEETVKQTRCTTCDADHEYKEARVPASRRRKPADLVPSDAPTAAPVIRASADVPLDEDDSAAPDSPPADLSLSDATGDSGDDPDTPAGSEEDWPVHRRLIRATLPRPEGQTPERKAPDFTFRQSGGRFDGNRNGARGRSRPRAGQAGSGGQHARSGSRSSGAPPASGSRQGNRPATTPGHRGGRPQGQGRGNRQGQPGGGQGRKRGR